MTKQKSTKRTLLLSALSLLMCVSMLVGSTFAWFTDSVTSGSNVIQSGNLDLVVEYTLDGKNWADLQGATNLFQKALWEPGHTEVVVLRIKNNGSLALKYAANMNITSETAGKTMDNKDIVLSDILTVSTLTFAESGVDPLLGFNIAQKTIEEAFKGENNIAYGAPVSFKKGNILSADKSLVRNGDIMYVAIKVDMAETVGNEANHNGTDIPTINFGINVLATQFTYENDSFGNQYDKDAEYPAFADTWDGTADFALFGLPRNSSDAEIADVELTEDSYIITTSEELAAFARLVDAGKTFEDKTVKLNGDIDLYVEDANGEAIPFDPIGSYRKEVPFKGTFDGQGHTIKNLSQNTWALDNGYSYSDLGLGLFGMVEDATIQNLTIGNAALSGESAIVGIVAATAYGDCTFENITVTNSQGADYQYYAGGIVGWASGNHQYINCDVDASTTIAAQWGDFDNSTGGVIGGAGGSAKIFMKDCDVACRIDAYNDVTSSYQWHAYRRCGMLIGNPGKTVKKDGTTYADAPQLTCENVTVTYGDWANYTYCEFAGTSWPYVRVQAGVSNSAYSNPRYGHPTDANGNAVIDDSHTHNQGEDHQILCVFDQLYGGGQGVYGTAAHEGVTIVYNNK